MSEQTAAQYEDALIGLESARAYAREAHSPLMRWAYGLIVKGIVRQGLTGRFLEIGAGPAVLTTMMAQAIPEARITAVDISPAMIAVAKEYVESEGLSDRIEFVEGDTNDAGLLDRLGQFIPAAKNLDDNALQRELAVFLQPANLVACTFDRGKRSVSLLGVRL